MEIAWFRRPGEFAAGSLNLAYHALDRHVIAGGAGDAALVDERGRVHDFAALLGLVSGFGGALSMLGVGVGDAVVVALDTPSEELVAVLGCARVGAVAVGPGEGPLAAACDEHRPRVVVTSQEPRFGTHVPAACIVRGVAALDDARDVDWEVALKAGRTAGSAAEPVPPQAVAYADARGPVRVIDLLDGTSPQGRPGVVTHVARLVAGATVDLTR